MPLVTLLLVAVAIPEVAAMVSSSGIPCDVATGACNVEEASDAMVALQGRSQRLLSKRTNLDKTTEGKFEKRRASAAELAANTKICKTAYMTASTAAVTGYATNALFDAVKSVAFRCPLKPRDFTTAVTGALKGAVKKCFLGPEAYLTKLNTADVSLEIDPSDKTAIAALCTDSIKKAGLETQENAIAVAACKAILGNCIAQGTECNKEQEERESDAEEEASEDAGDATDEAAGDVADSVVEAVTSDVASDILETVLEVFFFALLF